MFNLLNSGAGTSSSRGRIGRASGDDSNGYNNSQKVQEMLQSEVTASNYMKQMKRRWNNGDVYAPRDLSAYEMKGGGRRGEWERPADSVDLLGFSPLDNYRVCCPTTTPVHPFPFFSPNFKC